MSGGSMNYLYGKVEEAEFRLNTPLRRAFKEHLKLVSKALRDIEWVDSGDGAEDENASILACLPSDTRLATALLEAKSAVAEIEVALVESKKRITW